MDLLFSKNRSGKSSVLASCARNIFGAKGTATCGRQAHGNGGTDPNISGRRGRMAMACGNYFSRKTDESEDQLKGSSDARVNASGGADERVAIQY
jgi:hypothetical protein